MDARDREPWAPLEETKSRARSASGKSGPASYLNWFKSIMPNPFDTSVSKIAETVNDEVEPKGNYVPSGNKGHYLPTDMDFGTSSESGNGDKAGFFDYGASIPVVLTNYAKNAVDVIATAAKKLKEKNAAKTAAKK